MNKYIIKNKNTGEEKLLNSFPSKYINKEIKGFNYNKNDIYIIRELKKPVFNPDKSFLVENKVFTYSLDIRYYKVKVCNITYNIIDFDKNTILNKLATSLGNHLDKQYPLWERVKHMSNKNNKISRSAIILSVIKKYIFLNKNTTVKKNNSKKVSSTVSWEALCRNEYKIRKMKYLNNNVFPSFIWDTRPGKVK